MPVTPGTRLGSYEILNAIAAGGMGEVYRARDTMLGRDVAIKILPEAFADDPDRLARFDREARTLASLNHANIAAIYGIESTALVMELADGEDLSAIVARGPMAVPDRSVSRGRLHWRSKARMTPASSIAISSLPTSKSKPMAA